MAEIYLKADGNKDRFSAEIKKIKKGNITVFNYFWYPESDIITGDADIIVLPEIYSGNFSYINILLNNNSSIIKDRNYLTSELENIPSLYISSSLKLYFLMEKIIKNDIIKLKWNNLIFSNRIFSFIELEAKKINDISKKFLENNILLAGNPPYYSYLPLMLEDYQKKFFMRLKI